MLYRLSRRFAPHNDLSCAKHTDKNFSSFHFSLNRCAFTLAEVLITLGIIGIVAAITIPTIVSKYRKQVVETRLEHFYTTVNQAMLLAENEHGGKYDYRVGDELYEDWLKPYIKIIKRKNKTFWLPNGSIFWTDNLEFRFFPDEKKYKKQNRILGRDEFRFEYRPDTNVSQYNRGKAIEPYLANWDGDASKLFSNSTYGCNNKKASIATGSWCTAVIQRNGWKIPKNYPFKF